MFGNLYDESEKMSDSSSSSSSSISNPSTQSSIVGRKRKFSEAPDIPSDSSGSNSLRRGYSSIDESDRSGYTYRAGQGK